MLGVLAVIIFTLSIIALGFLIEYSYLEGQRKGALKVLGEWKKYINSEDDKDENA